MYRVAQKEHMFLKWVVVRRVKVSDLPKGRCSVKISEVTTILVGTDDTTLRFVL